MNTLKSRLGLAAFAVLFGSPAISVQGDAIDATQAAQAAARWLEDSPALHFAAQSENANPTGIRAVNPVIFSGTATQAWHIALDPAGYLVMAADNRLAPVIAFSVTSDLDLNPAAENALQAMLEKDVTRDLSVLDALDASAAPSVPTDEMVQHMDYWACLLGSEELPTAPEAALVTNVAPLLSTAWNQTRYFNDLLPACSSAGTGYNGHVPAGCGAIAGAQIFNYYQWPYRGGGQQGYYDDSTYRTTSLYNAYDWTALLTTYVYTVTYPTSNTAAIATLIRDIGYAAEMDYECTLSGSYNQSFSDAANRFFFYKQSVSMAFSQSTALSEINARRPLHVSYDESDGHILVADGLAMDGSTAYLHINYGWGGAQDGWYRPTSLYGSASLDYMTPGIEPLFMPMVTNAQGTVSSRDFGIGWTLPSWYTNTPVTYEVWEGSAGDTTNFLEAAGSLTNWWNGDSGWRVLSNQFFYCATNAHQGFIQLVHPLIPGSGSVLTYLYRRSLASVNAAYIEASADLGKTWSTLALFSGQVYDSAFRTGTVSLASYNGSAIYLRLRFRHSRGIWGWYGASKQTSGMYFDQLQVSNCRLLDWTALVTNLPSTTCEYAITNKFAGDHYHEVIARTTNGTAYPAPFIAQTTVDFDSFTLRAVALTNNIVLRWPDPLLCGFRTNVVHLRSHTSRYPTNTTDGSAVYTGTNTVCEDTGLTPGQSYYYTLWGSDDGVTFFEP